MKKIITLTLLFAILFMSSVYMAPVAAQHGDHESEGHCETPTATLTVLGSSAEGSFDFDKNEYKVERNTCYTLIFENLASVAHDLSIDEDGTDFAEVHMHMDMAGAMNMTIMTPDKDVTYKIYCSITGHEDQGMKAKLVVGEGSPEEESPGFTWFFAFAALVAPIALLRRRK